MSGITLTQMQKLIADGHITRINDHRGDFVDPVRVSKMDFSREITALFQGVEISGRYDPRDVARRDVLEDLISDMTGEAREAPRPTLEDIKNAALLEGLNTHYATLSNHRRMEISALLQDETDGPTRKDTP